MPVFNKRLLESLSDLPIRTIEDGATLISEGACFDHVFFLKNGTLKIERDGIEIARVDEPGSVFGEMSHFLERGAMATARADGDVEVFVAEEPGKFFRANPDVLIYVARNMARRIDELNSSLISMKQAVAKAGGDPAAIEDAMNNLAISVPRNGD